MAETDALGRTLALAAAPRRIVSLVPSWTELLFSLGADSALVGLTEFCVHPAEGVARVRRVGGTKNPDLSAIEALRPDLVIANKEENRRRDVERLEAAGIAVFVTYARTVPEAVSEMRALGRIVGRDDEAARLADAVELALAELASRPQRRRPRVAALVWRDPWMVVGGDTFANDLLERAGGENPFAAAGAGRYPRIERSGLEAAEPDVILLPTEPYSFAEGDRQELLELDCPAARAGRVHVLEGELLSWYGPRMARALRTIAGLLT